MGCYALLIILGFCAISCMTSPIQERSLVVREEDKAGVVIANMADLLHVNKTEFVNRKFKILSQKFIVDKTTSRRRKLIKPLKWLSVEENTGVITTLRRLDREQECQGSRVCEVEVKAVMLPQPHFSMLNLRISVLDINDNAPVFNENLPPVNVSEEAPINSPINIDLYRAKDLDFGDNSQMTYRLSENGVFRLEQYEDVTGDPHLQLILLKKLDYESEKQYILKLEVTDGGEPVKMSTSVDLVIDVIDANDNDPVFTEEEYEVTLKENLLAGYVIKTVRAVDLDDGDYGKVHYYLSDREDTMTSHVPYRDIVKVDESTGAVSLMQKLDRELHNGIRIPIEARDSDSTNQRIGYTWLVIHAVDINDNAPVITVNFIVESEGSQAYLSESAQIGTFVAYVIVSDADDGRNGEVKTTVISKGLTASGEVYSDARDTFKLVKNGLIQTNKKLDREICSQYQVVIVACDAGHSQNCSEKIIQIDVLDENEHPPVFDALTQHVTLREDNMVGTFVTTVQAYDGDSENSPSYRRNKEGEVVESHNGDVTYSITGNEKRFFSIDSLTGQLVLERPLDRESTPVWRVNVIARDGGEPYAQEGTCVVVIEIIDVNDNRPIFTNPSVNNSLIYASTHNKGEVAQFKAEDKDSGDNAMIRYSILNSPERFHDLFSIESNSGKIFFNKNFDLNNTAILNREHEIMIQAKDFGVPSLSSLTLVRIMVTNKPLQTNSIIPITTPTVASMDFMMLAIGLGSATVFLIILIVIIIIKCRRENEKVRTYRCRETDVKSSSCVSCNCRDSCDDVRSDTNTAPSSNPDTNSTVVNLSHHKDGTWNATNNRHETDSVLSGSGGYSSNSSHVTKNDAGSHAVRFHSSPNGHPPTITALAVMGHNLTSPIKKTGGRLCSQQDSDSGRGESETDVGSYDVSEACGRLCKRCPVNLGLDDVFQKEMEAHQPKCSGTLGPRCTDQCLRFGHSDMCWMPSPDKKFGNRLECIRETQLPSSSSVRVLPPKPRFYSDRSGGHGYGSNDNFLPRTCSKATSIDQISQISSSCSAPERSVSNEQHYIPSNDGKRNVYNKMTSYPVTYTRHPSLTRDGHVTAISDFHRKSPNSINYPKASRTRSVDKVTNTDNIYEETCLLPKPIITQEETQNIIENINKLLV